MGLQIKFRFEVCVKHSKIKMLFLYFVRSLLLFDKSINIQGIQKTPPVCTQLKYLHIYIYVFNVNLS